MHDIKYLLLYLFPLQACRGHTNNTIQSSQSFWC